MGLTMQQIRFKILQKWISKGLSKDDAIERMPKKHRKEAKLLLK